MEWEPVEREPVERERAVQTVPHPGPMMASSKVGVRYYSTMKFNEFSSRYFNVHIPEDLCLPIGDTVDEAYEQ